MDSGFTAVAHMPYMPNLSSNESGLYDQSVQVLSREAKRCSELGVGMLVVHFGSGHDSSLEEGHERVIRACKKAIEATKESEVRFLLETSAGKNSIGSKFEFVKKSISGVGNPKRMGVCLDTCHVFASGYDIRSEDGVRRTISEFDRIVGLSNLYLIHLNDSKGGLGDGTDRHEHIGLGRIGTPGFRALFKLPSLSHVPFILETPIDAVRDDKANVAYAKKLAGV